MMTDKEIRDALGNLIQPNGALVSGPDTKDANNDPLDYVSWYPRNYSIGLDGHFTVKQLEAIMLWVRNHTEAEAVG